MLWPPDPSARRARIRSGYVNMLECSADILKTHPQNQGFELPFRLSEISTTTKLLESVKLLEPMMHIVHIFLPHCIDLNHTELKFYSSLDIKRNLDFSTKIKLP